MKSGITCTQAHFPLLLEPPFPPVTHPAAVTARRQPILAAAARATAAGCRGAGDGPSSPGNQTCYPPGIRRARGQRAPAGRERKADWGAESMAADAG